jgi:uncharacterized coiled-coil DUF342 family protein
MKTILICNSQFYYSYTTEGKPLTEQQKTNGASDINTRIDALNEQINKAQETTRKAVEQRDKLNEEFRNIRRETQELKPERDSLNEKVKTLKLIRDETHSKTRTIIKNIKARHEKIAELRKITTKVSYQRLKREQEDIEWRIQTTSMDLQEEKRLVEEVKQLESQMGTYKKIEKQQQKIDEIRKELDALNEQAEGFHSMLSETAQKSQEIHQKMMAKIAESKKIKAEADSLHQAYIKSKQDVIVLNAELIGQLGQRRKLQQWRREEGDRKRKISEQVRKEEQKIQKEKQEVLKEKLGSQAREKLERGEKLSWDEFQLLAEDESETKN